MTLNLDDLERVAKAATPGPWEISSWHPSDPDGYAEIHADEPEGQVVRLPLAAPNAVRNTAHIATFNPVTVLALLARARDAERLGLALERLRAASSRANVRRVIADRVDEYPEDFDPGDRQEIRDMLADANAELCAAEAAAADLLSALNEGELYI